VWLRGTLPRIRYDQLMAFGWKILIPVSLAWILMIATIRAWRQHGGSTPLYIVGGAILGALLLLAWMGDVAAEKRRAAAEPATETAAAAPGTTSGAAPAPRASAASPGGTPSDPDAVPRAGVKEVTGA